MNWDLKRVVRYLSVEAGLDRNIALILNSLKDWLLLEPHLNNLLGKTMKYDNDRAIAVLAKALCVCRGVLYSARTGDASQSNIERLLESTGEAIAFAKVPLLNGDRSAPRVCIFSRFNEG
jgi:hypothetical protein